MSTPEDRELLRIEEVAEYLGVQPITVYRWCRQGRLPCFKLSNAWRIRRAGLEEYVRQRERSATLAGHLRSFYAVPDRLIAIGETLELLHRLDAAFFRAGEAHGGLLVKFYGGEVVPLPALREALERAGLAVTALERAGRLRFIGERDPLQERLPALRRLLAAELHQGRTLWAAFDWAEQIELGAALRQQEELTALIRTTAVVQTGILERVVDTWPANIRHQLRDLHLGLVELSRSGLIYSRRVPLAD